MYYFCMILGLCVQILYDIKPVDFCTILKLCVFSCAMLDLYVHFLLC
jgi:hypothetical protein